MLFFSAIWQAECLPYFWFAVAACTCTACKRGTRNMAMSISYSTMLETNSKMDGIYVCLFVTEEILYRVTAYSRQGSLAKHLYCCS